MTIIFVSFLACWTLCPFTLGGFYWCLFLCHLLRIYLVLKSCLYDIGASCSRASSSLVHLWNLCQRFWAAFLPISNTPTIHRRLSDCPLNPNRHRVSAPPPCISQSSLYMPLRQLVCPPHVTVLHHIPGACRGLTLLSALLSSCSLMQ